MGMVAEAYLGEHLGYTRPGTATALVAALMSFGLPTDMPEGLDADRAVAAMKRDKKARSETVRFAFLERIGVSARGADGTWTTGIAHEALFAPFQQRSTH